MDDLERHALDVLRRRQHWMDEQQRLTDRIREAVAEAAKVGMLHTVSPSPCPSCDFPYLPLAREGGEASMRITCPGCLLTLDAERDGAGRWHIQVAEIRIDIHLSVPDQASGVS